MSKLRLKRTALDSLELPLSVVHGYVGNINAKIPWRGLGSSPVVAEVSDIYAVVQPKKNVKWDERIEREKRQSIKKKKLESYEASKQLAATTKAVANTTSDGNDTFLNRLTETVINNLQVKIQNVHIRYEDRSDPDRPVVFGITMESLNVESTDENGVPSFIKCELFV